MSVTAARISAALYVVDDDCFGAAAPEAAVVAPAATADDDAFAAPDVVDLRTLASFAEWGRIDISVLLVVVTRALGLAAVVCIRVEQLKQSHIVKHARTPKTCGTGTTATDDDGASSNSSGCGKTACWMYIRVRSLELVMETGTEEEQNKKKTHDKDVA